MKYLLLFLLLAGCSMTGRKADDPAGRSRQVTVYRDGYGVAHVFGKTDADAVFGMIYAQCEESFERVERNYLKVLGRMAELEGSSWLYHDLLMRALYDTAVAKKEYEMAPAWLKELLVAFSEGISHYLQKNPNIKPAIIEKFEPWFPLLFPDGAYLSLHTGGIETEDIRNMYPLSAATSAVRGFDAVPAGSNAFALAPSRTQDGNALLFINPHVSFYFRTEIQIASEGGLNAYGAATWGQFFIYQGFNENCGWMHTSSMADAADLYTLTTKEEGGNYFYLFENSWRPFTVKEISLHFKEGGRKGNRKLKLYSSHHGPVLGQRNGKWLSLKTKHHYTNGLVQSWQRMKAKDLSSFQKMLDLRANNSTNTMYADRQGNIAYWHGNFVPERDPALNWEQPVDGSVVASEWRPPHAVGSLVHTINPPSGWLQNCNSSPFHVSGMNSIEEKKFPSYMAPEQENFRSARAIDVLSRREKWTAEDLNAFAHDGYLSMMDSMLPSLVRAYDQLADAGEMKRELGEVMDSLRNWNKRAEAHSVAATIAIFWSQALLEAYQKKHHYPGFRDVFDLVNQSVRRTTNNEKLEVLKELVQSLDRYWGGWKMPWGEINRFQKPAAVNRRFDDRAESLPVGFASALMGCLASYETQWGEGRKQYGVAGNSFVCWVSFGNRVKAASVVTGGQSFDPASPHFNDQAEMFVKGRLKPVLFYRDEVEKGAKRRYQLAN